MPQAEAPYDCVADPNDPVKGRLALSNARCCTHVALPASIALVIASIANNIDDSIITHTLMGGDETTQLFTVPSVIAAEMLSLAAATAATVKQSWPVS